MAISKFKITNSPSVLIPRMGTNFLIINNLYNISDEQDLNFQRIADLEGYFLNKKVKYKTYDPELNKYSNEAEIELIWKEQDPLVLPASADNSVLLVNNQSINFLEYLPINGATEFIEVYEVTETLLPAIVNDPEGIRTLIPGERFSPEDLYKSIFTVAETGGGTPYYLFKYKVGKNNQTENTIYTLQINVTITFEVSSFTQENWETTDPKSGVTSNYKTTVFEVTASSESAALGTYVFMGSKIQLDSFINNSLEIVLSDAVLFENIIPFSSNTLGTRFCKIEPGSTRTVEDLFLKYYDLVGVSFVITTDSILESNNYAFKYL